jgi:exonuclease VII large subunit
MIAARDRFVECLLPKEHLYLFSRGSVGELCRRAGAEHLVFEPPVFPEYDMFAVVSRRPLRTHAAEAVEQALAGTPGGRLVQALLDLGAELEALKRRYAEAERDRADRLAVIVAQGDRLGVMEAARQALAADVAALRETLERMDSDRAARLEVIHQQGQALGEAQTALAAQKEDLAAQKEALAAQKEELAAQKEALIGQEQHLAAVTAQMRMLQHVVTRIQGSRGYRLLRALGRWRFIEDALAAPPGKG